MRGWCSWYSLEDRENRHLSLQEIQQSLELLCPPTINPLWVHVDREHGMSKSGLIRTHFGSRYTPPWLSHSSRWTLWSWFSLPEKNNVPRPLQMTLTWLGIHIKHHMRVPWRQVYPFLVVQSDQVAPHILGHPEIEEKNYWVFFIIFTSHFCTIILHSTCVTWSTPAHLWPHWPHRTNCTWLAPGPPVPPVPLPKQQLSLSYII